MAVGVQSRPQRDLDGMHDGYQWLAELFASSGRHRTFKKLAGKKLAGSKLESSFRAGRRFPLHKLIVELGFPAIYTTNNDRNLALSFSSPRKIPCRKPLLARWGITVLTAEDGADINSVLVAFLSDILARMTAS